MKLSDHEQVVLKAIEHVAGSRNGLASVPAVTRAVSYPISTTQKILAALHRKEIIALHHHDFPAQMTADEKKRAVKIGNDYFHAVAIRNPMKRGAANPAFRKDELPQSWQVKKNAYGGFDWQAKHSYDDDVYKRDFSNLWDLEYYLTDHYGARFAKKVLAAAKKSSGGFVGTAARNPSPAQLKARAAFAKMAKKRAAEARKANPRKRRAANPRYLVSATDTRGNIADLGVLVSPNKTQAVARAKKLYKGYKKFTAAMVDKGDYIGPKGVIKIRRKRPTKKTNPRKASGGAIFSGSFGSVPINKKFRILPNEKAVSPADRGKVFTATNQRGQAKDADGYMHYFPIWASVELVNPTRNGIAKTAGKAIKKVTRAVLGGVSKVAGKGAKALKNPRMGLYIVRADNKNSGFSDSWEVGAKTAAEAVKKAKRLAGKESRNYTGWKASLIERYGNPKRRRNLDHRDSSHQVKVHQHWRAGGLSQWQRAHHAGQHDLFSHGIKAKPKRNPSLASLRNRKGEIEAYIRQMEAQKAKKYPRAQSYISKAKKDLAKIKRQIAIHIEENKRLSKRNPSASAIRKKFAGRVSGSRELYFPKGAPQGLAKLGRLVSIKLKGGKLIKPSRKNPSAEIWLCSDTSGKLWLGCTKAGPLYAGAPGDLGEMSVLEYAESKPHLGYANNTIWFHKMGEVSGRRPHLIVNDDQDLLIKGGNYKITRAGIVD